MNSDKLRQEFFNFFEKKKHKIVPSSSLLPSDPSVLFTTAGMQQFKPYFLGEKSPHGNKAVSSQKCFRTSDIEEVGDERHLTFFEMLGNFSFGGYGKEEAIKLAKDFLDSIKVKIDYVTVFCGNKDIKKDEESANIWEKFGFSEEKGNLKFCGIDDNFWGPTGDEGPCGPTTEIYSQGVEIWNVVFNQYYCEKNKTLRPLPLFGVDTGMGLERLAKVSQDVPTIFETDLFLPIISQITGGDEKARRIIADHVRGAVFLAAEGILPSNVERGYILRRLLRRAIRYGKLSALGGQFLIPLAESVIEIYKGAYPEISAKKDDILTVIKNEEEKFEKTLDRGLKEIQKVPNLTGEVAFRIYETYGFPLELTEEIRKVENREAFFLMQKKHQEISRTGAQSKFGGGGEFSPKLHTATHLLHAALRDILGKHVQQMGSDITSERTRFDFSHQQKMTEDEIKKVEELVNQKIKDDLEVDKREMTHGEALKSGALAFFKEKYPERVTVYSINGFSKEICAGPHVKRTGELGHFKIVKEESSGAGIRRLRAVLE
ncbi:MAG: alanine--tRNA ligase [Candidatus Nealsonbacteria bacterium]|nr:alanine--tRNA ligase [Candidatus Nealsonbacteria bacterium]